MSIVLQVWRLQQGTQHFHKCYTMTVWLRKVLPILQMKKQKLRITCLCHPVGRWTQLWIFLHAHPSPFPWSVHEAQDGSLTGSPNRLPSTVLTWNLPISALNLITEEFITCRAFQKELGDFFIQLFEGLVPPAPKGGTGRALQILTL